MEKILEKVTDNPRPEIFNFIAYEVYESIWYDRKKEIVKWLGLESVARQYGGKDCNLPVKKYVDETNLKGCHRLLMMCALSKFREPNEMDKERFIPFCKEIGIETKGNVVEKEEKKKRGNKREQKKRRKK